MPLQPTGLLPKNGDVITIPEPGIEIAHRLQWDPITSANSYIIYLTEIDASPILNFTNVGDRTSYDVPLRAGSYTWQIAAINEDQGENIIGPWSESQHFEVIRDIIAPVIINDIIQGNGTTVMLEWAPDGAIPVEVEVYHFYAGLEVWDTLPPMPLTSIDRENRVGTLDLGETMNEPGTHFFMIRGINEQGDIGKFKYFSLEN